MIYPHATWTHYLSPEIQQDYWDDMAAFLHHESSKHLIFPPVPQVYQALENTNPSSVRVVILGQDPYHGEGQAHGLSFSVPKGIPLPPSLRNIFKELMSDMPITTPLFGDLTAWTRQGVLLLNSVLSVRKGQPGSHFNQGWEKCTDTILSKLANESRPIAFVLWGNKAAEKANQIQRPHHLVIQQPHPSPLSAYRGFFGSKPFSTINAFFEANGLPPIDWNIYG